MIGKKKAATATIPLSQRTLSASLKKDVRSNQWAAIQATMSWADASSVGIFSAALTLQSFTGVVYRRSFGDNKKKRYFKTYWNCTFWGWFIFLAISTCAVLISVASTFLNNVEKSALHWPFPHPTSQHNSNSPRYCQMTYESCKIILSNCLPNAIPFLLRNWWSFGQVGEAHLVCTWRKLLHVLHLQKIAGTWCWRFKATLGINGRCPTKARRNFSSRVLGV